jgi:hypothetical protein
VGNIIDPDDDNDGIADISDPYPLNPLNDIEVTIDSINTTVNDVQNKVDNISTQISDINTTILDRILEAEINILDYLDELNASIVDEFQNLLVSITNEVIGMNDSLSNQLTDLLNNMTIDHDALRTWLEIVLSTIDSNLTATTNLATNLRSHDDATGQDHSDIIDLINDLLAGQIESERIDELRNKLVDLAGNLSSHNQSISDDIWGVVNDIDNFEVETERRLDDINNTLNDLSKLNDIITALGALNDLLATMEDDLLESIEDKTKEEEIEERVKFLELLLLLVLILIVVNIILTFIIGTRKNSDKQDITSKQIQNQKIEEDFPPPPPPPEEI